MDSTYAGSPGTNPYPTQPQVQPQYQTQTPAQLQSVPEIQPPQQSYQQTPKEIKRQSFKNPSQPLQPPTSTTLSRTLSTKSRLLHFRHRLDYIDGLKFIASILLFNSSFLNLTTKTGSGIDINSPLYFIRSSSFALSLFFILSGRILTFSFLSPLTSSTSQINWSRIAKSFVIRVFRFLLPVLVVSILQSQLASNGYTDDAGRVKEKLLAETAMGKPNWGRIAKGLDWWVLFVNLFSWDNVRYFEDVAGYLWLTPWALWASYFVYFVFSVLAPLSSNRTIGYGFLLILSWVTYSYNYTALVGLLVADLASSGIFRRVRNWKIHERVIFQVICLTVGLFILLVRPVSNALDTAFANIQRSGMPQIQFSDTLAGFWILLFVESSQFTQLVLGNPIFSYLGRLSLGIVSLHLTYMYTIIPMLALNSAVDEATLPSSFLPASYFTVFAATLVTSVFFFFLVEQPSIFLGKWIWKMLSSDKPFLEELRHFPTDVKLYMRNRKRNLQRSRSVRSVRSSRSIRRNSSIRHKKIGADDSNLDIHLHEQHQFERDSEIENGYESELTNDAGPSTLTNVTPSASGYTLNAKADEITSVTDEKRLSMDPIALSKESDKMLLDSKKKVEEKDQTKAAKRLTYVDGLRGIAVSIFFAHQFAEYTFAKVYPDVLSEGTFQYILRNGQFALALLFLLSGRVTPLNFFRKFATSPSLLTTVPKSKQPLKKFTPLSAPANTYFDYIQSMWRRLLQLALPVFVVIIIQYKVCDDGLTDAADQAEQFLRSTTLRKPNWCLVGTEGIGAFLVDVFSNRNHKYVLDLGSNLWTIYIQMWGTMFAYILAMIAVYIPRRRPLFYTVVVFWTWYTYNFNMLFAVGVILADLDITGHYKRFSSSKYTKWYKCLAVEISLVILSVSILTSYVLANALDDFAMWVTVREGVIGFAREFPVAMYPSRWLPAVLFLLWLDLSPVTQWFVGSWIFRIVGKVSTGFYLMHMTLIFGLFPKMFLSLRETNNVWNTLIISFVVIYILLIPISYAFYYLVEKLGANVADFSFAYLFVKPSTHISKLPAKLFTSLSATIPRLPSIIAGFFKSKYASFKAIFERPKGNPTRPPHDYGIRENVLPEELHSTFWDYDLSDDKDAMRTERLLRFNSYLAPAHFVGILGVALTWFFLNPIGPYNPEQVLNFASLWRSIWLLSIPYVVITFIGFSTPRIAKTKAEMDKQPVLRQYVRNFYIAIVTQGSNEEAVRRGYEKMKPLARCHPSIRVVVLTDEPYAYPDLDNFVCPKAYRSEMGKAKHKARALDYFRKAAGLTQYDWVLHMDEESTIDAASLRRCFDFIRYSPHHFGQGVILYNAYSYWSNPFFTVADAIRVGDDLARFSLQYLIFQRPTFGAHGSFLMNNGLVENTVTWDFGTLAEDFEFSHKAWEMGFTCGAIHGIVREQSPSTIRDFLKQRRRWYMGIRDIQGLYYLPQMAVKLWSTGVFCLVATIINIPFSFLIDGSATPMWIAVLSSFCFAVFYWLYLWGLLFQELDSGTPWWKVIIRMLLGVVLQPFCSLAEAAAVVWAMASENVGKFEVIKK